jgi:hypothetical protein
MGRTTPSLAISLLALSILGCSAPTNSPHQSASLVVSPVVSATGNNSEAVNFAKAMTEITRQTWPQAEAVWSLELTPQEVGGDVVQYRKSVTHCKATISISDAWFRQNENSQRNFIGSALKTLHQPPAMPSGELDYYPNSTGELQVAVKGRVVAHGTYTKSKSDVRLEPGTYAVERSSSGPLTASVSIANEGSVVRFQGSTNVPDGDSILVTLKGHGYEGQTKVLVVGGGFTTEGFSNRGRAFSPGTYSLQFNVFEPKSGLMIEAKRAISIPEAAPFSMVFRPVKF